ncbi:hypothetical protein WOLCODRAFT_143192 [Wolfiporia cocos MD-104 SS10]|uniref:Uncharacterized protein n=1 Tax=Wolfiporia cocos (strain MD-104) TaxID=742152 RepID=A0A2H3JSH2_WOLCO|nr:hypothetical protein WOLCODRAFT_143192 [Wolfiporia cocos MD-104 SS10]
MELARTAFFRVIRISTRKRRGDRSYDMLRVGTPPECVINGISAVASKRFEEDIWDVHEETRRCLQLLKTEIKPYPSAKVVYTMLMAAIAVACVMPRGENGDLLSDFLIEVMGRTALGNSAEIILGEFRATTKPKVNSYL